MKKAAAILLALMMAIPAFAEPLCAMACGGGAGGRPTCCCSSPFADTGDDPALTAPSCCNLDPGQIGGFGRGGAAIPTVASTAIELAEFPLTFPVSVARTFAGPATGQFAPHGLLGGPMGSPISLLSPPLRL